MPLPFLRSQKDEGDVNSSDSEDDDYHEIQMTSASETEYNISRVSKSAKMNYDSLPASPSQFDIDERYDSKDWSCKDQNYYFEAPTAEIDVLQLDLNQHPNSIENNIGYLHSGHQQQKKLNDKLMIYVVALFPAILVSHFLSLSKRSIKITLLILL
jgi:hypothetical protein